MSMEVEAKNELEAILDEQFPKGKSKSRGAALVLFAQAMIAIRNVIKACGGCSKCYGKGYSTQGHGGDTKYNTCTCDRGKQIDDLIETVSDRAGK